MASEAVHYLRKFPKGASFRENKAKDGGLKPVSESLTHKINIRVVETLRHRQVL